LWWAGATNLPWLVIALLLFAPQLTTLFELALSRAREFEADLDAAGLTGDPAGLASALAKLERAQRSPWERILMPGFRLPEPSILRSHPATEERVARLRTIQAAPAQQDGYSGVPHPGPPKATAPPRSRVLGYWY
jgi:heat shock protein HtpX